MASRVIQWHDQLACCLCKGLMRSTQQRYLEARAYAFAQLNDYVDRYNGYWVCFKS